MRLITAELRSRDGDTAVVAISDGRGGEELLTLPPEYSSSQFLPDVGGDVPLLMQGPVPMVMPRQIAVDAITAKEARFDLVTAMLFYGAKIVFGDPDGNHGILDSAGIRLVTADGTTIDLNTPTGNALITGEYRSAESGSRFVINPDRTNPGEIRFYSATDNSYGSIKANAVPELEIVGPVGLAGFTPSVELNEVGAEMAHSKGLDSTLTTQQAKVSVSAAWTEMTFTDNTLTPDAFGRVTVGPYDIQIRHTANVTIKTGAGATSRVEADTVGVGFNGVTPIARRTVNAAAATAAETQTLVNQLRTLLIDLGLAQ